MMIKPKGEYEQSDVNHIQQTISVIETYGLLSAGTVVVLVLDGLEKIHAEDLYWAKRRKRRQTM